jgi:hypothetical protein
LKKEIGIKMADYKKFRMVGPVAVYLHKQTARPALKIDGRFKPFDTMEAVEEYVKKAYPEEARDVIYVQDGYPNKTMVTRLSVIYSRDEGNWIDASNGQSLRYSPRLYLYDPDSYGKIMGILEEQDRLREQIANLSTSVFEILAALKRPQVPK